MSKLIFCIVRVPNVAMSFVVTSEETEKQNITLAMEKDAEVTDRHVVSTDKRPGHFFKEIFSFTDNVLFGHDGAIYGDLQSEENVATFKALIERIRKPVTA